MPPYCTKEFPTWIQDTIFMFTLILGREDDVSMDGAMLALIDWYHQGPTHSLRYVELIGG